MYENNTHCDECGRELGLCNVRETANGKKVMCCYCADKYDSFDWTSYVNRSKKIEQKKLEEKISYGINLLFN